jgi:molybdopterin synthase catalytic subunit
LAVAEATTQICVRVRLFASYREAAGSGQLEIPLAAGARVSELVELLAARVPALRTSRGLIAVNQTYVTDDPVLADRDEVAFIPPVSGGV